MSRGLSRNRLLQLLNELVSQQHSEAAAFKEIRRLLLERVLFAENVHALSGFTCRLAGDSPPLAFLLAHRVAGRPLLPGAAMFEAAHAAGAALTGATCHGVLLLQPWLPSDCPTRRCFCT